MFKDQTIIEAEMEKRKAQFAVEEAEGNLDFFIDRFPEEMKQAFLTLQSEVEEAKEKLEEAEKARKNAEQEVKDFYAENPSMVQDSEIFSIQRRRNWSAPDEEELIKKLSQEYPHAVTYSKGEVNKLVTKMTTYDQDEEGNDLLLWDETLFSSPPLPLRLQVGRSVRISTNALEIAVEEAVWNLEDE